MAEKDLLLAVLVALVVLMFLSGFVLVMTS